MNETFFNFGPEKYIKSIVFVCYITLRENFSRYHPFNLCDCLSGRTGLVCRVSRGMALLFLIWSRWRTCRPIILIGSRRTTLIGPKDQRRNLIPRLHSTRSQTIGFSPENLRYNQKCDKYLLPSNK